ncbi:MAG: hypothetical protein KAS17_01410 [Victivallaceae bacterium]|nr:hypothetical protein [Victivallaceae bacterium]
MQHEEKIEISRFGSNRIQGQSKINIELSGIEWNYEENVIEIKDSLVSDLSTDSHHNYTIKISLSEISKIIQKLGDEVADNNPNIFAKELSTCLREIIRLEKVCIGEIGVSNE